MVLSRLLVLAGSCAVSTAQLLHLSPADIERIGSGREPWTASHAKGDVVVSDDPRTHGHIFVTDSHSVQGEELIADSLHDSGLCDSTVAQQSGYLDAGGGASYFFWLFESRSAPRQDPLVVWLTGGPGCSSQLALLAENGPCMIDSEGKLVNNAYSWTERANVMWVDQPGSTGFSYGASPSNNKGVAIHMHAFLESFYKKLPQYKTNDFYLFGESYAGHYVPAIAHYLWRQSKVGNFSAKLKGIGIGNGLTDPEEQMQWYPDMAKDGGKSEGGTLEKGVITDEAEVARMKAGANSCAEKIRKCTSDDQVSCMGAYGYCVGEELMPYENSGMNVYDMRIPCEKKPLCYDFDNVDKFLNDPETQKKLGVTKTWSACDWMVNSAISEDWVYAFHKKLPDLLADDIRVLIYAGDVDYICNWLGNKKWMLKLDWPHRSDFNAAKDYDWLVDGKSAGRLRSANGLYFLQVFQAGHMVPMDQPAAALKLFNDFLGSKLKSNLSLDIDPPIGKEKGSSYNFISLTVVWSLTALGLVGVAVVFCALRQGAREVPVSKPQDEGTELPALPT